MIRFEINGRKVDPNNLADAMLAAMLESIAADIREKVGSIRDPDTGEFPTVVVRGRDLDNLQLSVEGSEKLIAMVKERLGLDDDDTPSEAPDQQTPHVFLSYTSDDAELAERIAKSLRANGIETWWDKWCIRTGDSLRQKIDEGLAGCTHFLVLLTPSSIHKPWVNQEMDAGLVRKLNDQCRFLPVRYQLAASDLPPLLSGMHAPEITADEDISQLINDIYGVNRKPPLGPKPAIVKQSEETQTGYSPSANVVARLFVERSRYARFADPQFSLEELAKETGLSVEDVKDALYELSVFFKDSLHHVLVESSLFPAFDKYWKPWDPAEDALRLAADIGNDPNFPADCQTIADLYKWEARRLNSAITYLFERNMLLDYHAMGVPQFVMARVVGKPDEIRRFVKSRT